MNEDKKSYLKIASVFSILLFLLFCNIFQPNVSLGDLTIGTIFFSILLCLLTNIIIIIILLAIWGIISIIIS